MGASVFEPTVIVELTVSERCSAAGLNASSVIDMVCEHEYYWVRAVRNRTENSERIQCVPMVNLRDVQVARKRERRS